MPKSKAYLKDLYRTKAPAGSRKDCLRLDMNENVTGLPEAFLKKIKAEINPGLLAAYPEYTKLKEKIASHNSLKAENICLSNGSDAAIKYIFDAYISCGDKILLTDPTFAMYPVYCKMFNAEAIKVDYKHDLSFPEEDFRDKISPDIKMAVVVNPNNPTGSVLKKKSLISLITKARDNDVLIIVDEAYFYFYPETVMSQVKKYSNLIVLRTFSKLCGIASLRLGYAAASPRIIQNIKKVQPTYDINGLGALFAEKILDNPNIVRELTESVNRGKRFLTQKLSEERIEYIEGAANFVLIKCKTSGNEIIDKLAKRNILISGGFKQEFLKDYVRVTVGDKPQMVEFWNAFIHIWKKGGPQ